MNTELNNVAIASLEVPSNIRKIRLQEGAAVSGHLVFGLIKFLMVSTPFLSMVMMILALWGVVGKTTYTDLEATKKGIAFGVNEAKGAEEAKNYLVNETKNIEQCSEELKSPEIVPERANPMPNKIDWKHTI